MKRVATLVLILSILSVVQKEITDYNRDVSLDQFDKTMVANSGVTFSHDWGWGIDYPMKNRNLILGLSIAGFLMSVLMRRKLMSLLLSFLAYALTLPLIYQWLSIMARDVAANESFMRESPYLLRIAATFDWLLFVGLGFALCTNGYLLFREVRSTEASLQPLQ